MRQTAFGIVKKGMAKKSKSPFFRWYLVRDYCKSHCEKNKTHALIWFFFTNRFITSFRYAQYTPGETTILLLHE
jgi:hypothetical protein